MILVFDFDGTLHNTAHLYGCAFRKAYAWLVMEGQAPEREYTDEELTKWLGVSAPDMWHSFMPQLEDRVWREASSIIGQEMIRQIGQGNALLYPGITEALDQLKAEGYIMVLLSNCRHGYMEAHRLYFGLDRWFAAYFCAEDYDFRPKEDIYLEIAAAYANESSIIIGDRDSDFQVGLKHGLPVIGCSYGFGTADELALCTRVIDHPQELTSAVKLINQKKQKSPHSV